MEREERRGSCVYRVWKRGYVFQHEPVSMLIGGIGLETDIFLYRNTECGIFLEESWDPFVGRCYSRISLDVKGC